MAFAIYIPTDFSTSNLSISNLCLHWSLNQNDLLEIQFWLLYSMVLHDRIKDLNHNMKTLHDLALFPSAASLSITWAPTTEASATNNRVQFPCIFIIFCFLLFLPWIFSCSLPSIPSTPFKLPFKNHNSKHYHFHVLKQFSRPSPILRL